MTVISSTKNLEALSLTLVAEFDAGVERVWQIWEDPRQLERWWGPPTWPATFEKHDFVPGGEASYYMTGPGRREGPRLVAVRRHRRPAPPRVRRRFRRRQRRSVGRAGHHPRHGDAGADRRPHPDDHPVHVRVRRADGADRRDGHGRGHEGGRRARSTRSSPNPPAPDPGSPACCRVRQAVNDDGGDLPPSSFRVRGRALGPLCPAWAGASMEASA